MTFVMMALRWETLDKLLTWLTHLQDFCDKLAILLRFSEKTLHNTIPQRLRYRILRTEPGEPAQPG